MKNKDKNIIDPELTGANAKVNVDLLVSKPTFVVEISQNGWEYTGYAYITAKKVKQIDDRTIRADGVIIKFDEDIGNIEAC